MFFLLQIPWANWCIATAWDRDAEKEGVKCTCCRKWKDAVWKLWEFWFAHSCSTPSSSSSSLFFCLLFFSFFLPLPGFLTMTKVKERYRETGGREGEGRGKRVLTSTVNDIMGSQPLLCLFSLISFCPLCTSIRLWKVLPHSIYFMSLWITLVKSRPIFFLFLMFSCRCYIN